MRAILAKVIWNFDLELYEESENWMDNLCIWFIWFKDPLMVKLTSVERGLCDDMCRCLNSDSDVSASYRNGLFGCPLRCT